ncbi:MAG: cupin domain-containing protein [Elusimicrobia bacterium]|nr:cupin domain-containing protein [Elusimicrobiota bacterium]
MPFAAGNLLEYNIHVIEPGGSKLDNITNRGQTVGYMMEGRTERVIDTTPYELDAGDSFFLKNHLTNRSHNPGPGIALVLWINTPQIH